MRQYQPSLLLLSGGTWPAFWSTHGPKVVRHLVFLYSLFQVNIWFALLGGTTIILGAYYMLRMFQHVMLGETNTKLFADVTFNEALTLVVIVGVLFFFGLYPKPIMTLITPSLENILTQINRFN